MNTLKFFGLVLLANSCHSLIRDETKSKVVSTKAPDCNSEIWATRECANEASRLRHGARLARKQARKDATNACLAKSGCLNLGLPSHIETLEAKAREAKVYSVGIFDLDLKNKSESCVVNAVPGFDYSVLVVENPLFKMGLTYEGAQGHRFGDDTRFEYYNHLQNRFIMQEAAVSGCPDWDSWQEAKKCIEDSDGSPEEVKAELLVDEHEERTQELKTCIARMSPKCQHTLDQVILAICECSLTELEKSKSASNICYRCHLTKCLSGPHHQEYYVKDPECAVEEDGENLSVHDRKKRAARPVMNECECGGVAMA